MEIKKRYYHVEITSKSDKSLPEVELDLSERELSSRFIEPYNKGDPIIIDGRAIPSSDLERIRIGYTHEPSDTVISKILADDKKYRVAVAFSPKIRVIGESEIVTNEFIKGPPGYKGEEKKIEKKLGKQSNRVFVVHGHDEEFKNDVERFLREIDLEPVVLHRQPDRGLTIIEKLEEYSNVDYVFILLTPDDIGYPAEEHKKPDQLGRQK